MKTTISLPDELLASADAVAERLGLSRSALIASALTEFVAKHRFGDVSERLSAVYGQQDSALDGPLASAQRRTIVRSDW